MSDAPIQNFSNCHTGIVSHLQSLERLPALLEPARQARSIAGEILKFFRSAVYEHHSEEETELFPAVLAAARAGEERAGIQAMVDRLVREHRQIEAAWSRLEPALKQVAKGADGGLDGEAVASLVADYLGHAAYEEREFLPLCQTILGRDGNQMAALGMSLHLRHAVPEVTQRLGFRI